MTSFRVKSEARFDFPEETQAFLKLASEPVYTVLLFWLDLEAPTGKAELLRNSLPPGVASEKQSKLCFSLASYGGDPVLPHRPLSARHILRNFVEKWSYFCILMSLARLTDGKAT